MEMTRCQSKRHQPRIALDVWPSRLNPGLLNLESSCRPLDSPGSVYICPLPTSPPPTPPHSSLSDCQLQTLLSAYKFPGLPWELKAIDRFLTPERVSNLVGRVRTTWKVLRASCVTRIMWEWWCLSLGASRAYLDRSGDPCPLSTS